MRTPFPASSLLAMAGLLSFSLAIRLPALWIAHSEGDELVYEELAHKASWSLKSYTLQGSPLLQHYPSAIYDKPLFHHPPLFVWLLALVEKLAGRAWGMLLPVFSGVFCVLLTYLIGRELYGEKEALFSAAVLAVSPTLLLTTTHIWIDGLLCALLLAAGYLSLRAASGPRPRLFALAGAAFGLAILTKIVAVFFISFPAFLFYKKSIPMRNSLLFLTVAGLIATPWFIVFYRTYGILTPAWDIPTPELMRMYPFVDMIVHRPLHFYFTRLLVLMPVYLFIIPELASREKIVGALPEILWALAFLIPFTSIGLIGVGYQLRYVLPGIPALALLSGKSLARRRTGVLALACAAGGYSLLTGILNAFLFRTADPFPLFSFFPLR